MAEAPASPFYLQLYRAGTMNPASEKGEAEMPQDTTKERRRRHETSLPPLNGPFPGCCTPYPDVRFSGGEIVNVWKHHVGNMCAGYRETVTVAAWKSALPRYVRGDALSTDTITAIKHAERDRDDAKPRRRR